MEIYQETAATTAGGGGGGGAGFRALKENFARAGKKEKLEKFPSSRGSGNEGRGGASAAKTVKKGLGAGAGPNTQRRRALGDISNNNGQSAGRIGKGSANAGGLRKTSSMKPQQKPPRFNLNLKKGGIVVHEENPVSSARKPTQTSTFGNHTRPKPLVSQGQPQTQIKTGTQTLAPLADDFEFDTCTRRTLSPSPEFDGGFDVDAALAAGSSRRSRRRKAFDTDVDLKARPIRDDDLFAGLDASDNSAMAASVGEPDAAASLDLSDLCEDLEF